MYICGYCRAIVFDIVEELNGEKIHTCFPKCRARAIKIEGHDCTKFQEMKYTAIGLIEECFVCEGMKRKNDSLS